LTVGRAARCSPDKQVKKLTLLLVVFTIGAVGFALYVFTLGKTTYALGSANLELQFVVLDADSNAPIADARIELIDERYWDVKTPKVEKLATDGNGMATYPVKDNTIEDVIRPLRKTKTLIDLVWASVKIRKLGYEPAEIWLHNFRYENEGFDADAKLFRLRFNIPLKKTKT
jgi:hypothetical protein